VHASSAARLAIKRWIVPRDMDPEVKAMVLAVLNFKIGRATGAESQDTSPVTVPRAEVMT
jgi:hypothetical protein